MKKTICSLTSEQSNTQATFWKWIDQQVRRLAVSLTENILLLQMQAHLQADWNQRTAARRGHRNGYYSRWLTTTHGRLRIRVPSIRVYVEPKYEKREMT